MCAVVTVSYGIYQIYFFLETLFTVQEKLNKSVPNGMTYCSHKVEESKFYFFNSIYCCIYYLHCASIQEIVVSSLNVLSLQAWITQLKMCISLFVLYYFPYSRDFFYYSVKWKEKNSVCFRGT